MKIFSYGKDGGPDSNVSGFWLCEFKSLFSVVLLKFKNGTRDAYHNHAFNSLSWIIKGQLIEKHKDGHTNLFFSTLIPIITKKDTFHQVESIGTTWVFSIRGPWSKTWKEYNPSTNESITLQNGRIKVN